MKILDNKGQIVYDWVADPEMVLDFLEEKGFDIEQEYPIEFLRWWRDSDHGERPLCNYIKMFPFLMESCAYDKIVSINGESFLAKEDMFRSDEPEAWEFWEKVLHMKFPDYQLVNDSDE